MSRISDIRQRSKLSEEIYTKKINRVRDAVADYIQSDFAKLTIANHFNGTGDITQKDLAGFARELSEAVAGSMPDPVEEFEQVCAESGLGQEQAREVVEAFATILMLDRDTDFGSRKLRVAGFLHDNKEFYGCIGLYKNK